MVIKQILKKPIVQQILTASKIFSQYILTWLGLMFFLSIIEIVLSGFSKGFSADWPLIVGWSFLLDFVFWISCIWFSYLLFVLLYLITPKLARVISMISLGLLTILQLALISYFNTALVPLGSDLYSYTMADILQTVGASSGLSFGMISTLLLTLICIAFILLWIPKRIKTGVKSVAILLTIGLFGLFTNIAQWIGDPQLSSEFTNNLVLNKTNYFLSSTSQYFSNSTQETDIYADSYIGDFEGNDTNQIKDFTYPAESEYPFYHTSTQTDVLSPFFKPLKSPPNVVILLVEGLGRAFTNEGAYLGNFTPFLDSLSGKSLYWKNFLSNGGRTFAVLPSLLGSLPFAKNGFLEMGAQMPDHLSLYSLLKFNGYHTSFYYGGDAKFDGMETFLRKNAVNEINDGKTFPNGYTKLPSSASGFSWGYTDDQLFKYYLNRVQPNGAKSPELNVILTVATHDPFLIPNQAKYLNQFEKRMSSLGFDEEKKANYRNFKLQYSSILYADEALKAFFAQYEKDPAYKNTIFLITGDHRMPEIPMSNKIDRFHVPLIIYSPLLKRTAVFESISSHFDITPSLLAFLQQQISIKLPNMVSWMGDGLDTARSFRNIHRYPLIQTKTTMIDYVSGAYHLNGETLYQLNSDMGESVVADKGKVDQLKSNFTRFKNKNDKLSQGYKLLPDTLIKRYSIKQ